MGDLLGIIGFQERERVRKNRNDLGLGRAEAID